MLDQQILSQLEDIFSSIEGKYEFISHLDPDTERGKEMREFLKDLCTTSHNFTYREKNSDSVPGFSLIRNGEDSGITFTGIPGGHEFNTLIMAIVNADGKGKNLPDDGILQQIGKIKGPAHFRTFVSLSCINCPDVAQNLNIITLNNPDITHEIIDGNVDTDEMARLGIQSVPTTYADGEILSVGRANIAQLFGRIKYKYGMSVSDKDDNVRIHDFPLIVLGGGPAGIAAAIYSARKNIDVALIAEEAGGSVNLTNNIENLVTSGVTTGGKLAAVLKQNATVCGVKIFEGRKAVDINLKENLKEIICEGNEIFRSSRIIIATGSRPRRMNVPGEDEYIGRGVAFCTHCDGPLFKDKDVAVTGGGNAGIEAAIDLAAICKSVTVFEFLDTLKADNVLIDRANSLTNVNIFTGMKVQEVLGDGTHVTGIRVKNRNSDEEKIFPLSGIFVQIGSMPDSALVKDAVETNERGEIKVDCHCRTSAERVYAAGDVTDIPYKQIATAVGSGATAALACFEDSLREQI